MKYIQFWLAASAFLAAGPASGQPQGIDTKTSTMTVRVGRAGALSGFGHDHEIAAPIASGSVDITAHTVSMRVDAKAMRVRDPGTSEHDREEIQRRMLGPEVLDTAQYPEIAFKSTTVTPAGEGSWKVNGNLTLHGQSRPVTVDVLERAGHYTGHATLKQTDFGIQPIKIAGGVVRVKDEVRIEFDIHLSRK